MPGDRVRVAKPAFDGYLTKPNRSGIRSCGNRGFIARRSSEARLAHARTGKAPRKLRALRMPALPLRMPALTLRRVAPHPDASDEPAVRSARYLQDCTDIQLQGAGHARSEAGADRRKPFRRDNVPTISMRADHPDPATEARAKGITTPRAEYNAAQQPVRAVRRRRCSSTRRGAGDRKGTGRAARSRTLRERSARSADGNLRRASIREAGSGNDPHLARVHANARLARLTSLVLLHLAGRFLRLITDLVEALPQPRPRAHPRLLHRHTRVLRGVDCLGASRGCADPAASAAEEAASPARSAASALSCRLLRGLLARSSSTSLSHRGHNQQLQASRQPVTASRLNLKFVHFPLLASSGRPSSNCARTAAAGDRTGRFMVSEPAQGQKGLGRALDVSNGPQFRQLSPGTTSDARPDRFAVSAEAAIGRGRSW